MIEDILNDLQQLWAFTPEQLHDLRLRFAEHGMACVCDSRVMKESEEILCDVKSYDRNACLRLEKAAMELIAENGDELFKALNILENKNETCYTKS